MSFHRVKWQLYVMMRVVLLYLFVFSFNLFLFSGCPTVQRRRGGYYSIFDDTGSCELLLTLRGEL